MIFLSCPPLSILGFYSPVSQTSHPPYVTLWAPPQLQHIGRTPDPHFSYSWSPMIVSSYSFISSIVIHPSTHFPYILFISAVIKICVRLTASLWSIHGTVVLNHRKRRIFTIWITRMVNYFLVRFQLMSPPCHLLPSYRPSAQSFSSFMVASKYCFLLPLRPWLLCRWGYLQKIPINKCMFSGTALAGRFSVEHWL